MKENTKKLKLILIVSLLSFFIINCNGQPITINGTAQTKTVAGTCGSCSGANWRTAGAAATSGTNCINLTSNASQAGAAHSCTSIDLNQSFDLTFTANFGTYSDTIVGDGIAFMLRDSVNGCGIGAIGGNMGYSGGGTNQGTWGNTLATEFDTNEADGNTDNDKQCDNVAVQYNLDMSVTGTKAGPACANCGASQNVDDFYLSNGSNHTIRITWNGTNAYTVYVDGKKVLSMGDIRGYFVSPGTVAFSFTAATGPNLSVTQSVCDVVMNTNVSVPSPCGSACCTLLPIEIASFSSATFNHNSILLKWTTVSEINNNYFEIEKSQDGFNWSIIGNIPSQNSNSSQPLNYEFIDVYPVIGINYYRLKQFNLIGGFEVSNIINTQYLPDGVQIDIINQNSEKIEINIFNSSISNEPLFISLYDLSGKQVFQSINKLPSENYKLPLPLKNYSTGIYFLKAQIGGYQKINKLAIHK